MVPGVFILCTSPLLTLNTHARSIEAENVVLQTGGYLFGNIFADSLDLEPGGVLVGTIEVRTEVFEGIVEPNMNLMDGFDEAALLEEDDIMKEEVRRTSPILAHITFPLHSTANHFVFLVAGSGEDHNHSSRREACSGNSRGSKGRLEV